MSAREILERPDGKIEVDGRVYAVATGAAVFGFPGWPIKLVVQQIALNRSYATFGADKAGDLRPRGGLSLRGIGRIQGGISQLGVLGAPTTLTDTLAITLYPIDEDEISSGTDWVRRARTSWPLNVVWVQNPPSESPWFEVRVQVPEDLLLAISSATTAGHIDRLSIDIQLERAFVIDRERPNGPENEPAFLAPFNEQGRQPGPNLGYVSSLAIRERPVPLRPTEAKDEGSVSAASSALSASPTYPAAYPDSPIKQIATRLIFVIGLLVVLIIVILIRG